MLTQSVAACQETAVAKARSDGPGGTRTFSACIYGGQESSTEWRILPGAARIGSMLWPSRRSVLTWRREIVPSWIGSTAFALDS